jgi:hypothetical protein
VVNTSAVVCGRIKQTKTTTKNAKIARGSAGILPASVLRESAPDCRRDAGATMCDPSRLIGTGLPRQRTPRLDREGACPYAFFSMFSSLPMSRQEYSSARKAQILSPAAARRK